MSGKQQPEEPSVDDYEFYLAEDFGQLDVDVDDKPKTAEKRPRRLSERGPPPRKMTAQEALAAATRAEAEAVLAERRDAEQRRKVALAKQLAAEAALALKAQRLEEEQAEAEQEAEWARAAFGSSAGPGRAIAGAKPARPQGGAAILSVAHLALEGLEGVEVLRVFEDIPLALIDPLYLSHQLRAQRDGDLAAFAAFGAVRDALEDRPDELSAARVIFGEREWGVWLDGDRIIAALEPADLYLVGL